MPDGCRRRPGAGAVPLAALALALLVPAPAGAGDAARGREAARACGVCHGRDGIATRPDAPNLAGQTEYYVREQLLAYRDGRRRHPQMEVIARDLSDADIDDLAAWYSSIGFSVQLPAP